MLDHKNLKQHGITTRMHTHSHMHRPPTYTGNIVHEVSSVSVDVTKELLTIRTLWTQYVQWQGNYRIEGGIQSYNNSFLFIHKI